MKCVDDYDDLVPEGSDVRSPVGGISPQRPGSPVYRRDVAAGSPAPAPALAPSATKGRDNILYDRFPTPVAERLKMQKQQVMSISTGAITEDEDEEETDDDSLGPRRGEDLLREIEGRLQRTPTLGGRGGSLTRSSPPLGMGAGSGQRLQPQHANSDPVLTRQNSPQQGGGGPGNRRGNANERMPALAPGGSSAGSAAAHASSSHLRPKEPVYHPMEDDGYGYAMSRPKNLQDAVAVGLGFRLPRRNALPPRCFKRVDVPVRGGDGDEGEEDYDGEDGRRAALDPYPRYLGREEDGGTESRVYLSSRHFMQHFATQFYEVARRIGKGHLTSGARLLAPRVMCREEREGEDGSGVAKEAWLDFVPTVEVGFWPNEAIEWYLKTRPKVYKRRNPIINLLGQQQQD